MLDEDEHENGNEDDEDVSDSAACTNDEGDVVKIKRKVCAYSFLHSLTEQK